MKLVPHDPKSSQASRPPGRASSAALLFVASILMTAGAGCDIVQGYKDAGDSLFPEQSTHLASPGVRIASGHYRELRLVASADLFLLARDADDTTGKLFAMRYADPHPCEIPQVVRFNSTRDPTRSVPLLSYLKEEVGSGTLHFADATCKTYSLTFEGARLPVGETAAGVVVWAGSDLWLASPETGSQERLADGVTQVINRVFGSGFAVVASDRLTVFDSTWTARGTFGDQVSAVLRTEQNLFYVDVAGVHRIVPGADSQFHAELLVSDACSLATQDGVWLTLRSPCAGGKLLAMREATGASFTLPFDAEPGQVQLVPARGSSGVDPEHEPFWFFFLRSGDTDASQNTLFVRTPAGEEHALGAHSTLRQLRLIETAHETHGYALVDVVGETGRYIWWNPAGETRVLAESTMWRPGRLIIDSDGTVGKLAVASGDRLLVLAEGVPWQAFEYQDTTREWTVLFHELNGLSGQLSVFYAGLDGLQATPPDQPFAPPELIEVASNVTVVSTASLNNVLSGVSYFTNFDLGTRTGRLEYRNLELRFTAGVNEGVSDYLVARDELLYSVPYGQDAGIWLVSGK